MTGLLCERQRNGAEFADHAGSSEAPPAAEIHALLSCPPFRSGNFALVRRKANGEASLLLLGRAPFVAPTLNLALLRRLGAEAGANEAHLWTGPAFDSR